MKRVLVVSLVFLVNTTFAFAGAGTSTMAAAAFSFSLTVSDGAGGSQVLQLGVDPAATDAIDAALGESERPPSPPSGVFDARLIGDDIAVSGLGQGVVHDYREGDAALSGTRVHEIKYQVGSGTAITIQWDLPSWATGVLQDFFGGAIVNESMSGSGSYVVTNPGVLTKLKVTITYVPPLPVQLVDLGYSVMPGGSVTLQWKTLSEVNNYGFIVQRKLVDGAEYMDVTEGFLPGKGTTLDPQTYSFTERGSLMPGKYAYRLKQVDLDGTVHYSGSLMVTVGVTEVDGTELEEKAPRKFALAQNHPNPFNPATRIRFTVESPTRATVVVYSALGTEVATVFDGNAEPGRFYQAVFYGTGLASGVYFYRLTTAHHTEVKRMLLVR